VHVRHRAWFKIPGTHSIGNRVGNPAAKALGFFVVVVPGYAFVCFSFHG